MSILIDDSEIRQINTPHNKNDWVKSWSEWNGKVAKAQAKKIYEWGNEDCPHVEGKLDKCHYPIIRCKRECEECWQALSDEVKEGK